MKALTEEALLELFPVFDGMYSKRGRDSIPPGRLLKATLRSRRASTRTPSFLASVITSSIPLYRLEKEFERSGGSRGDARRLTTN